MSTYYIDLKYTKLLGGRLRNFKQKRGSVFAFQHNCESQDSRKTRGNIFQADGNMMFHCYHCSSSSSFSNFLRSEDPNLHAEYRMEVFKENVGISSKPLFTSKPATTPVETKKLYSIDPDIIMLDRLPENSGVIDYVRRRCIPESTWQTIGVVSDFYKFASKYDTIFGGLNKPQPRLVFPFLDVDGSVICYSARAFGSEHPKYATVMVDRTRPKIYGLHKLDISYDIFAVEGQIDSLFLDNSIAVNGGDFSHPFLVQNIDKIIIVPDSDWKRNRQVYKALEDTIQRGFRVALFPDSIPWKDINDCVVKGGLTPQKIMNIIRENVFSGLAAKTEIGFRKKFKL